MKTALLISGYLRSFKLNISNIKELLIQKFPHVDVYVHITKNENTEDKYLNECSDNDILILEKELNPVCILKEYNATFSDKLEENNLYNTWSKFYKLNEIKKINERSNGKYDLVIKTRPDLHILSSSLFNFKIKQNTIYLPAETVVDSDKLNNKNDPNLCDIFAFGDSSSMDLYFNMFTNLNSLCNEHGYISETLLFFYLNSTNLTINRQDIRYSVILSMCNTFAICGDSASGKSTLSKLLKTYFSSSFTLECDRYHKWERGNPNWKNITHLNPESNFITKMNKDIFDLKIGKTIYQVDYDHNTGQFTDKQEIHQSNNIIVCGLHSLYAPNHIYNLTIYMDTEDSLKTLWKVVRDTKQRGYTIPQVLSNIKKRQKDYIEFILPQKQYADVIVKFFPLTAISTFDANPDIGLVLSLSHKFSVNKFHEILIKNDINYEFMDYNNMFIFTFNKFKPIINASFTSTNTFYDYILLCILEFSY